MRPDWMSRILIFEGHTGSGAAIEKLLGPCYNCRCFHNIVRTSVCVESDGSYDCIIGISCVVIHVSGIQVFIEP